MSISRSMWILLFLTFLSLPGYAQNALEGTKLQNSPSVLPGKGLEQHSFLYCGEWNYVSPQQTIWLFRNGKPVWTYSIPYHVQFNGKEDFQELGDCSLLPDGSVRKAVFVAF